MFIFDINYVLMNFEKKILIFFIFFSSFNFVFSQVVFFEDFENSTNVNTKLPQGWTESGLSKDGIFQVGDSVSSSFSVNGDLLFYIPYHSKFAYTSDVYCSYTLGGTSCNKSADRIILPVQNFNSSSKSLVINFDTYFTGKLGVSANLEYSIDNGLNWIKISSINSANHWLNQTIDISDLKNKSNVLVSFRFNDNNALRDGFAVDNVKISLVNPWVDLGIVSSDLTKFTKIPSTQLVPLPLNVKIVNFGSKKSDTSTFELRIYSAVNQNRTLLKKYSKNLSSFNAKDTILLDFGTVYSNELTDAFEFEFEVIDNYDTIISNNLLQFKTDITLNEYARDDASFVSVLGLNSSNTITLGNMFEIVKDAYIDSVSVYLDKQSMVDGSNIQASVFPIVNGLPLSNPIGYSSIVSINTSDTNSRMVFKITDNFLSRLKLDTGKYLIAINKFTNGSSLSVKMTNKYFSQNAVFVKIGNANFQTLDTYFSGAYKLVPTIRMYCSPFCNLSANFIEKKADCSTSKGDLTVIPKNGSYPYKYLWSNTDSDSILNNVLVGKYNVSITDKFNCQFDTVNVVLNYASSPRITVDSIFHPTCYGVNNGYISMKVIDSNVLTKIFWNKEQTNTIFHDKLYSGSYNVKVYNAANCFDSIQVEITSPDSLNLTYSYANETDKDKGEIYLFVSGGTPSYSYFWNDSVTTKNRNNLDGGLTYQVVVKDQNNCQKSVSIPLKKLVQLEELHADILLECFPNPTIDILNIKTSNLGHFVFQSVSGEILLEGKVSNEMEINVSSLSKGVYFFKLYSENKSISKKIVII
jgi:hypothetical protein